MDWFSDDWSSNSAGYGDLSSALSSLFGSGSYGQSSMDPNVGNTLANLFGNTNYDQSTPNISWWMDGLLSDTSGWSDMDWSSNATGGSFLGNLLGGALSGGSGAIKGITDFIGNNKGLLGGGALLAALLGDNDDQELVQTQERKLPAWYEGMQKTMSEKAMALDPYQQFFAPGASGLSALEQQAVNRMTTPDITAYMNPYTEQVIDATTRRMNEQFAGQDQALAAQAVSRGAFGGPRADMVKAQQDESQNRAMAETIAGLNQQAFGNAMNFNTQGAQMMGTLGGAGQGRVLQDYQLGQMSPATMLQAGAGVLGAVKPEGVVESASVGSPPSMMQKLAGAGTALMGLNQAGLFS
jgi:hypothetical protein